MGLQTIVRKVKIIVDSVRQTIYIVCVMRDDTTTNEGQKMTTMHLEKVTENGRPAIWLIVSGKLTDTMRTVCNDLGIEPEPGIWNRRKAVCRTPAELDAVRGPLKKYAVGAPDKDGRIELVG